MLGFLLRESARDFRRAGRLALGAIVLIAISFGALGVFWVLSTNLGTALAAWREQLRVIVFLREQPSGPEVAALMRRVEELPGVARVQYVSKAEALARLKQALGARSTVADTLPENPLPASLELTPKPSASSPDAMRALIREVGAMREVEEVHGGAEWVDRVADWQRLLQLIGLGIGVLLGLAAVVTVMTATTLALDARGEELEIMRLVGAPESMIRLPLLFQGMAQGLLGAALGLGALVLAHRLVSPHLGPLVSITLGLPHVAFLSLAATVVLLAGGALLGGVGGLLAKGRA